MRFMSRPTGLAAAMSAPPTRPASERARQLVDEFYRSPTGRGVLAALPVALAARRHRSAGRLGGVLGLSVGMTTASVLSAGYRLEREVRNSADSAGVSALVGRESPSFGTWAVEADFAQLVASEVIRGRERIVECGSGATTVVIAACLKARGSGTLVSIEHDASFAAATQRQLEQAGLSKWVHIVVAPLVEQTWGSDRITWYDISCFAELAAESIDLLVVDGPPSVIRWARWPAGEYFLPKLAPGATVLLDDGRRGDERRTVFRWEEEHDGLEVYWLDTVKGTWRVLKSGRVRDPRQVRLLRRFLRAVHPNPPGFARWPVRR